MKGADVVAYEYAALSSQPSPKWEVGVDRSMMPTTKAGAPLLPRSPLKRQPPPTCPNAPTAGDRTKLGNHNQSSPPSPMHRHNTSPTNRKNASPMRHTMQNEIQRNTNCSVKPLTRLPSNHGDSQMTGNKAKDQSPRMANFRSLLQRVDVDSSINLTASGFFEGLIQW
eukprot:GHVO01052282.1.p1 GENE.GHVO01052282.1~~GHVO01052282.1.p1  ORF type:complete len:168 (+),score=5.22 GHVO01052282.1:79-582(+)